MKKTRLVIGISGSSGAVLGIRMLEALRQTPIETHLIITPAARLTIEEETHWKVSDVIALADAYHQHRDLSAPVASGSFATLGMVVIPCSVKSLSAIANSYSADLLTRAADVTLKEGRPLILVFREAPLHAGHIRLMEQAAQSGAVIFPPVPAFYAHPQSVDEIVDNIVGRVMRRLGIDNDFYQEWQGLHERRADHSEDSSQVPPMPDKDELWNQPVMTLATTGENGMPFAAAVYFAADQDHKLYFFSAGDSQHSTNLAMDPHAAATIHPTADNWQEIRGLQLRGQVRLVPAGQEWDAAWALYQEKFSFAADLSAVVAKNNLYVFDPDWTRMIDNRRGFGYKEEWISSDDEQPRTKQD